MRRTSRRSEATAPYLFNPIVPAQRSFAASAPLRFKFLPIRLQTGDCLHFLDTNDNLNS
jgi:hypothetical protein